MHQLAMIAMEITELPLQKLAPLKKYAVAATRKTVICFSKVSLVPFLPARDSPNVRVAMGIMEPKYPVMKC